MSKLSHQLINEHGVISIMQLTKKQSKYLNELLKDLNKRCSKNEEVKLALRNFTCGHVEIYFELFCKNKGTALGNYSEIREYIDGE